jgi:hypothetical protein
VGRAASPPNWTTSHATDQPQPAHDTFAPVVSVRDNRRRRFFRADCAAADQAGRQENCRSYFAPRRRPQPSHPADRSLTSTAHPIRTLDDLERTVRAIATEFKTDKIFIIGSQGILLAWPDAPPLMRASPEIDAYPGNARDWETQERKKHPDERPEASEHIDALFGSGSQFHRTHGFYIDGVDENTAIFPAGWQTRAIVRQMDVGGRTVTAIAPCPEDLIVSKLARLDDKDKSFIEAYHSERPLDPNVIEDRIRLSNFEPPVAQRARAYIRNLTNPRR